MVGDIAQIPHGAVRPEDVQASFCEVLVDEWIAQGVTYAALAPGSRSTPLALALMRAQERVESFIVDVFHDERSAAFAALGAGLASGRASIVLCTSGTAAAHLHAAIIEADRSAVPMIVCTADRPAELRDVGAPQTIDQTKLYGDSVRWFHDPGVPVLEAASTWRSLAARSSWSTQGAHAGPVHLNLPFREPLVGTPIFELLKDALDQSDVHNQSDAHAAEHQIRDERLRENWRGQTVLGVEDLERLSHRISSRQGVIVAGRGCGDPRKVDGLARALGWPVFAEPRAGCGAGTRTILHFDALVRVHSLVDALDPEIVLRLGEPPSSKVLAQWVAARATQQIHVDESGQKFDPDHRLSLRLEVDIDPFLDALTDIVTPVPEATWWSKWYESDLEVRALLEEFETSASSWSALTATRAVARVLPAGSHLVLSSSMPIRDVEWFAGDCSKLHVHANRGVNGIDGVIATAIGVARASGRTTYVLLGDVAAIHDASTLLSLAGRDLDVRVIVINNDGGSIFHHLPQATSVDARTFESIYGTPHGLDFARIGAALDMPSFSITGSDDDLAGALLSTGPSLIHIRTDRDGDLQAHRTVQQMIAERLHEVE